MNNHQQTPFLVFHDGKPGLLKEATTISKDENLVIVLKNYLFDEFLQFMEANQTVYPSLQMVVFKYNYWKPDRFEIDYFHVYKIPLNIILIFDAEDEDGVRKLIGLGRTTTINWDGTETDLPEGWRGSVHRSYLDHSENKIPDTLIGLSVEIEDDYRRQGWAKKIVVYMKELVTLLELRTLAIPLQPPERYLLENASSSFEEFISQKQDGTSYKDHWIRLHVKMGAKVLKFSAQSHRMVLNRQELMTSPILRPQHIIINGEQQEPTMEHLSQTGEYVICMYHTRWYKIYVNAEHDFVLLDEAGVWVEHSSV